LQSYFCANLFSLICTHAPPISSFLHFQLILIKTHKNVINHTNDSPVNQALHKTQHFPCWKWPWYVICFAEWTQIIQWHFTWLVCTGHLCHNPCSCQLLLADTRSIHLPPNEMPRMTGCILCAPPVHHRGAHHSRKGVQPVSKNDNMKCQRHTIQQF
jgi:hypothetical protein